MRSSVQFFFILGCWNLDDDDSLLHFSLAKKKETNSVYVCERMFFIMFYSGDNDREMIEKDDDDGKWTQPEL